MVFEKKYNFSILQGENSCFDSILPSFEVFLLGGSTTCLFKHKSKYINQIYFINKSYWSKTALYQYMVLPSKLTYVVDGLQFFHSDRLLILQYNYSFFLRDIRVSLFTNIAINGYSCVSLSSIFLSTIWLERELSEFSGLFFEGLSDSRRLLIDYFQRKRYPRTHIDNERSYSDLTYEVSLNF